MIRFRSSRLVNPLFLANTIRYSPQCRPRSLSAKSKRLLKAIAVYPSSFWERWVGELREALVRCRPVQDFILEGVDIAFRLLAFLSRAII